MDTHTYKTINKRVLGWVWWLTPAILGTQEMEVGRRRFEASQGKTFERPHHNLSSHLHKKRK
jgi:hypothetical protein